MKIFLEITHDKFYWELFSKLLDGIFAVSSAVIIEVSSGIGAGILNRTRCVVTDNFTRRFTGNLSDFCGIHAGGSASNFWLGTKSSSLN